MLVQIASSLLFLSTLVGGEGEFIITHTPSHVSFQEKAHTLYTSELSKVIALTYGFSVNKDIEWDGLMATSPFVRPKANVVVSVDGVPRSLNIKSHRKYKAENDDPQSSTSSVVDKLQSNIAPNSMIVDFTADNSLFDLKAQHPEMFTKMPSSAAKLKHIFSTGDSGFTLQQIGALNTTNEADLLFLGELHIIQGFLYGLRANPSLAKDNVPDFYHLKVVGMQRLVEEYGKTSQQVRDALDLLETVLDKVTEEFRRLYSDNLIIQVVTSPPTEKPSGSQSRRVRSLLADQPAQAAAEESLEKQLGVAPVYSDLYSVMFNIFLWGGIAFVLVVYAISYGIWVMDPGKDSIIYRMTSQRMKKD